MSRMVSLDLDNADPTAAVNVFLHNLAKQRSIGLCTRTEYTKHPPISHQGTQTMSDKLEAVEQIVVEDRARKICVLFDTDPDQVLDTYGPVRRWDSVAYHISEAIDALRTPTPEQAGEVERLHSLAKANNDLARRYGAENKVLREAVSRSGEGWSNVLELDLLSKQHRETAQALADQCHAALQSTPPAVERAHEIWAMAQVGPNEGVQDAVQRIAAALPTMAGDCVMVPRDLMREAQFLCNRLDDLEWGLSMDEFANLHAAHVDPSHSRLKGLLAASPTGGE